MTGPTNQPAGPVVVPVADFGTDGRTGGIEETFRENDLDHGNRPIAEFVVILEDEDDDEDDDEDEERMRLRIIPTIDNRGGIAPTTLTPAGGPERNDTYGPFMHWSDDGLLSIDREEHVAVYRVGDAPARD